MLQIKRLTLSIVIIGWMALIYGFSGQDREASAGLSEKFTDRVVHIVETQYDELEKSEQEDIYENLHVLIRKGAHVTEYAILGVLIFLLLSTFATLAKRGIVITIIICSLYAVIDEWHQSFVGGRGPSIRDVAIDAFGACIGIVICLLMRRLFHSGKARRQNEGMS